MWVLPKPVFQKWVQVYTRFVIRVLICVAIKQLKLLPIANIASETASTQNAGIEETQFVIAILHI